MTSTEARKLIADSEYEPETYDEAAEIFAAIIGRQPDADDGDQGSVWSHACAAVQPEPWDPELHAERNETTDDDVCGEED